jgi:hypothetical protein
VAIDLQFSVQKEIAMLIRMFVAVAAGLLLNAGVALGHHAFSADFDAKKPVTLNGTVSKVEWSNPHAHLYLDVIGPDGTTANWKVELASRDELMKQGWTTASLKVGGKVSVRGWQAKNGSMFANADTITADTMKLSAASSYYGEMPAGTLARSTGDSGAVGTAGNQLPRTASPVSLIALLGGLSLVGGLGLRLARR